MSRCPDRCGWINHAEYKGDYLFSVGGEDLRVELIVILLLKSHKPEVVVELAGFAFLLSQLILNLADGLNVLLSALSPFKLQLQGLLVLLPLRNHCVPSLLQIFVTLLLPISLS